jgi:hypothetical protein
MGEYIATLSVVGQDEGECNHDENRATIINVLGATYRFSVLPL